jgi:hypothetical protein
VRWANGKADIRAREPAHRRMPRVHGVEGVFVSLLLGDDRVFETNLLKRFVPLDNAAFD